MRCQFLLAFLRVEGTVRGTNTGERSDILEALQHLEQMGNTVSFTLRFVHLYLQGPPALKTDTTLDLLKWNTETDTSEPYTR